MTFEKIVRDIKSLKIQGATAVAKEGSKSLLLILKKSKAHTTNELNKELHIAANKLIKARETEPALRNALKYIVSELDHFHSVADMSKEVKKRVADVQDYFKESRKKLIKFGANKIKDGYIVFTHCHSTAVCDILKEAKRQGKRFEVHNTETRPRFQGRKTAEELSKAGIPVTHYVDSGAIFALHKVDLFLFGADAAQSDGRILNKIGTDLFLEHANKHDIPSFSCMDSWKFDPITITGKDEPIEMRSRDEVWKGAPKKIKIINPAFEVIEPQKVTGVISELGVFRPGIFPEIVHRAYPWMF